MANPLPNIANRETDPPDRMLLTTKGLSAYLGVPVATLKQWRREGTAPRAYRVGRQLRYRRSDVDAWLEARADPPTRDA